MAPKTRPAPKTRSANKPWNQGPLAIIVAFTHYSQTHNQRSIRPEPSSDQVPTTSDLLFGSTCGSGTAQDSRICEVHVKPWRQPSSTLLFYAAIPPLLPHFTIPPPSTNIIMLNLQCQRQFTRRYHCCLHFLRFCSAITDTRHGRTGISNICPLGSAVIQQIQPPLQLPSNPQPAMVMEEGLRLFLADWCTAKKYYHSLICACLQLHILHNNQLKESNCTLMLPIGKQ